MIAMQSMALDDEEKLDMIQPMKDESLPEYPYGLRICISQDEMAKLGIEPADAQVGGYFLAHVYCCITSVSSDKKSDGSECHRMEAQIEQMSIEGDDAEAAPAPKKGLLYNSAAA